MQGCSPVPRIEPFLSDLGRNSTFRGFFTQPFGSTPARNGLRAAIRRDLCYNKPEAVEETILFHYARKKKP
jgi:hypothetical protein